MAPQTTGPVPKKHTKQASEPVDIDSGDESDGLSALRKVDDAEERVGGRRGPENKSLEHFKTPEAIVDKAGGKKWLFKCKYCSS